MCYILQHNIFLIKTKHSYFIHLISLTSDNRPRCRYLEDNTYYGDDVTFVCTITCVDLNSVELQWQVFDSDTDNPFYSDSLKRIDNDCIHTKVR